MGVAIKGRNRGAESSRVRRRVRFWIRMVFLAGTCGPDSPSRRKRRWRWRAVISQRALEDATGLGASKRSAGRCWRLWGWCCCWRFWCLSRVLLCGVIKLGVWCYWGTDGDLRGFPAQVGPFRLELRFAFSSLRASRLRFAVGGAGCRRQGLFVISTGSSG